MRLKEAALFLPLMCVPALLAVLFGLPGRPAAHPPGVSFSSITLAQALEQARGDGRRVFAEFSASWCPSCQDLESQVLATKQAGALTSQMIAVKVDFDDPSNRRWVERYVILGLPTVIVLSAEGEQLGRIMGYDGSDDWLAKARQAAMASDPRPALRETLAESPDNPHAMLALGAALLVRGPAKEGAALLERVAWRRDEPAEEALFLLGRYHHRVKQDPSVARHIWRELAARFPDSEHAPGAMWWHAKAQGELDQHEVGVAALLQRAQARPTDPDATIQLVTFVGRHELTDHKGRARDMAASLAKGGTQLTAEQRQELSDALAALD